MAWLISTAESERVVNLPLASSQGPAGGHPQRQHDDEQDGARADRHQGLEDETSVEVDPI